MSEHVDRLMSHSLKYARIERERRFLLARVPDDVEPTRVNVIEDLYVEGTRLRVRAVTPRRGRSEHKLTQKIALGDGRGIITSVYLSSDEFARLDALRGVRLAKQRLHCTSLGVHFVIDVFRGALDGLVIAEAEAASDDLLRSLPMPPFAHCEVTDCFELTGGSLALADPAASLAFARRLLAQPHAAIPSLAEETPPIVLRALDSADSDVISRAFAAMGWNKPAEQYRRYLDEQASGERSVIVAERGGEFAGYATVRWSSSYEPFVRAGIPEIEDLNVVNRHRRHGVATALLDEAEARIAVRSRTAGIGVGLHPGYNAAQRLYGLRGYVPDGRGVTYQNRAVAEGESAMFDDALVLRLTKAL